MTVFDQNINNYLSYCDKGLRGEFRLPVNEVSLDLTNVCNNYCIMCQFCSKEYKNHTYFNEEPFFMTLEQYKKIVPAPRKTLFEKIFLKKKSFSQKLSFLFGSGETLLNPHLYDILKYTKEVYPNSTIRLISNGTVPPKDDIVRYVDRIAFSIDSINADVFETLRPPAKLKHVLKTIKQWDETAERFNSDFKIGFAVVVSTANIDELTDIVRLAAQFKHIDSVYLQPIYLYESRRHLDYLSLRHVDKSKINSIVRNLESVSNDLNVRIDNLKGLQDVSYNSADEVSACKTNLSPCVNKKSMYCHYPWNGILLYDRGGGIEIFVATLKSQSRVNLKKDTRFQKGFRRRTLTTAKSIGDLEKICWRAS